MAKRLYCSDIEADDLLDKITKVWCMSNTEFSPHMEELQSFTITDSSKIIDMFDNPDNILIMHNGVSYDGPAITKVHGVEVKAEIIDTLFLSWYLYPKMNMHGLAAHGETFGIPKPVIDDWKSLSIEDYKHRCKEDVKIQSMLWKQIWKHLMLLYGNVPGCWRIIRHLNFKAKCAALQEKSGWRLDVAKTEELEKEFSSKFDLAKNDLELGMPDVPEYATRTYPAKGYKVNGELSANGIKWIKHVQENIDPEAYFHGNPMDYKEDIKVIKGYNPPNAGSHAQLKSWLTSLGWIPESFKHVRDKDTNITRMVPQIKNQDTEELCDSIERLIENNPALVHLREMSIVKHRLGVVSGFLKNVNDEGFVYAAVQGLTNTLRFKHKICVNLPSARKPYGELIRSLLISRNEMYELCGSDMSSLEDRTKQHYMFPHDPDYVTEMRKPGFDPHLDMAIAAGMLNVEQSDWYKAHNKATESVEDHETYVYLGLQRHAGKSTNYAATYGARGPTVARSAGVEEEVGDLLVERYWERNWCLQAIADECIVKTSRGMKWLWNPVAQLWIYLKAEKDRFSTLNQSTGTFAFDRWVYYILFQRNQLTAQFHDEVVLEILKGNRDKVVKLLKSAMSLVNEELDLNVELDCDIEFGDNYGAVH